MPVFISGEETHVVCRQRVFLRSAQPAIRCPTNYTEINLELSLKVRLALVHLLCDVCVHGSRAALENTPSAWSVQPCQFSITTSRAWMLPLNSIVSLEISLGYEFS
jgi:hypothetical protein